MMKKPHSFMSWTSLARLCARLKADRKGGVLMLMGLAVVPLTFALGFGVDYARAMRLQTQLDAAADAAALAAVSPAMILLHDDDASAAATNMFKSQAAMLTGYQNLQFPTPVITDNPSGSGGSLGYLRKVTVTYTAQSINVFGGLLGAATLTVHGTSSATAEQPPNVDFYLAMDNSPSMLIPATSAGITDVQNVTGCAFACHEYLPRNDSIIVRDRNKLRVLLSASYYTSGSPMQNVYYLYNDSTGALYDSSGNALNTSPPPTSTSTTTTSGSRSNPTTVVTTVTTTTTTKYSIPSLVDSKGNTVKDTGPTVITKTISSKSSTTTTTTHNGKSTTSTTTGNNPPNSSTYDTGYWADGYWLTHNYGLLYGSPSSLTLRKDDVVSAATQLIPFAASQAKQYNVTYQAQMFSFDWTRPGSSSPVKPLNSILTDVKSYGSSFSAASLFPTDDYWWQNSQPTSSTNINDQATEMTNMLTTMNSIIPKAGSGAAGDTPQKILFIVTDGMLDQAGRYYGPLRTSDPNNDLPNCTAIKAKGIKIAVLYTQYLPETLVNDNFSQQYIAPFLPAPPAPYPAGNAGSSDQVLTALQKCASPGINGAPLVQTVTANDSIITALQQLFSTALQSSRLVQ